jgi:hypothetical protein
VGDRDRERALCELPQCANPAYRLMTLVAWVVYRKVGLRLLRSAWLNMDWVWAAALVVTGVVVLFT